MSNLKKQVAEIQRKLALSHAEMIARLKKSETDYAELRTVVGRLASVVDQLGTAVDGLATGQKGLRLTIEEQAKVQQGALDQLLELVTEE